MPQRIEPGPGQESVWDYPRPPRLEQADHHIRVIFNGEVIAETRRAWRVLETSHPPVYYIPLEDIKQAALERTAHRSFCEFKGQATYWTVRVGDQTIGNAAWSYPQPTTRFTAIKDYLAFYASKIGRMHRGWRNRTSANRRLLWRVDHGEDCWTIQGWAGYDGVVNLPYPRSQ